MAHLKMLSVTSILPGTIVYSQIKEVYCTPNTTHTDIFNIFVGTIASTAVVAQRKAHVAT